MTALESMYIIHDQVVVPLTGRSEKPLPGFQMIPCILTKSKFHLLALGRDNRPHSCQQAESELA